MSRGNQNQTMGLAVMLRDVYCEPHINAVQSRLLTVRDQQVLLDRDVAALYGVETHAVNQAGRRKMSRVEV